MFGPEYFTVVAYETEEGEILCRACGEKIKLPTSASISQASAWERFGDGTSLWCDDCRECIVEPDPPADAEVEEDVFDDEFDDTGRDFDVEPIDEEDEDL